MTRGRQDSPDNHAMASAHASGLGWHLGPHGPDFALIPSEMTGTPAPLLSISGRKAPCGTSETLVAWAMWRDDTASGTLADDRIVVTCGDGDFPIAVAHFGQRTGHLVVAVVPESISTERREALSRLDAEIVAVRAEIGDHATLAREAEGQAGARDGHFFDKNTHPSAARFHAEATATMLLNLARDLTKEHVARGRVDAFVFPAGDAAQCGAARALKSADPECRIVAVQPASCPFVTSGKPGTHRTAGLTGALSPHFDRNVVDVVVTVDESEVARYMQLLEQSHEVLVEEGFVAMERVDELLGYFDHAAMFTLFGATRFARTHHLDHTRLVTFLSPGPLANEASLLAAFTKSHGTLKFDEAVRRLDLLREIDASGVMDLR